MGSQTRPLLVSGRRALEVAVAGFVVVVESGPDAGLEASLSAAALCAGTDRSCDLVLTDPTVSRRHVNFTATEGGVVGEDLGSTNGTWLSGVRIRPAFVPDRSRVKIGDTVLRVEAGTRKIVAFPQPESEFHGIIGRSQPMRDLFALIRQIGRTDLPVLVTGETGSGKELVARAIHRSGPRSGKPFLVLDCASIVPELLKSELFGHEKGAFTGADRATSGILEEAAGGTVFLDEMGEMDLAVQPNLLRALEMREITRLGSRKPIPVDFRIVAATNRDLAAMSRSGRFREDLFYRLACVTISIPPLRERTEDIELLAREFLTRFCQRNRIDPVTMASDAAKALTTHGWPGNVRELRNVVELLAARASGTIEQRDVEVVLRPATGAAAPSADVRKLDASERDAIVRALEATGGSKRAAAKQLGISRSALYAKMQRLGIAPGSDDKK